MIKLIYTPSESPGQKALFALGLSKSEVSSMSESLKSGEISALASALSPILGGAELSAHEYRDMLDQLVCFRVYMRVFLGKYGGDRELFSQSLDELERALAKPGREMRTVLPRTASPEISLIGQQVFYFDSLCALLLFDMQSAERREKPVRQCRSCGECFIAERRNSIYCPGCRPFAAAKTRAQTVESDPLLKEYQKTRSRIYAAKSRGRISPTEAEDMLSRARAALKRAKENGLAPDELGRALREIKLNDPKG